MHERRRPIENQMEISGTDPLEELGLTRMDAAKREQVQTAKPLSRKKRRDKNRTLIVVLCSLIALVTLVMAYYFIDNQKRQAEEIASQLAAEEALRVQQEQERVAYEAMLASKVFAEGITVNDIAIGGMTMDEAKAVLSPVVQQIHSMGELQLTLADKIYSINLDSIVIANDLDSVLAEAYKLGKEGEYTALKAELAAIKTNGRAFSLRPTYDEAALRQRVSELATQIDTPMQDAKVESVNTEDRTITFADEVPGVSIQQEELTQAVLKAMQTGSLAPLAIPVIETKPAITKDMLSARYVMRSSATTNFSSSISERKYNIRKGAGMITGTVLKPGAVFSANDALGTRTAQNGWKNAGAYEGGMVVEQAGGGVCQLSSTLYNAAVKADLEIVTRRNHSMPVAYISEGLDATINSVGNIIDFQFKNSTSSDIVLFAYTTNNKTVTFEIWGIPFPNTFDEIKLTAEKLDSIEPDGAEVVTEVPEGTPLPDGTLVAAGQEYVISQRRSGSRYQSYKVYYKDGERVSSEKLALSTYKAFNGEKWVGPAVATVDPPVIVDPNMFATPPPVVDTPPAVPDGGGDVLPDTVVF